MGEDLLFEGIDSLSENRLNAPGYGEDGEASPQGTDGYRGSPDRDDVTARYFHEIREMGRLTPEQEIQLAREIRSGSNTARERFISANLRLVIAIAKGYYWRCNAAVSGMDLIQEGNIGLMKAVERFDPEAGFRFSTYATHLIRQAIERFLNNHARIVRSPVHMQNAQRRYWETVEVLRNELGRSPSTGEIALAMGMKASSVELLQHARLDATSLNYPSSGDDDTELIDHIADERMRPDRAYFEKEEQRTLTDRVVDIVDNLPYPHSAIIKLRFGLESDETLSVVSTAQRLGLSNESVRKYEGRAKNVLRRKFISARNLL